MSNPLMPLVGDRAIFDALPDLIWIRNADGVIVDVNETVLQRLGYSRAEVVGRHISHLYYDAERDAAAGVRYANRVIRDGRGFFRVTVKEKSGRPVDLELHGKRLDAEGGPYIMSVGRDIGEHLREERLARTLSEAFRRSNDVMFYSDRNGVILDVNEAFVRTYGWTREEAVGQSPRILRSRHSTKAMYERMWSSIVGDGYWRGQIVNRTKDGREIPLVLTITAVRDGAGEILGYISNGVDMSEQTALQARVAHAEALAAIGEMAAVVAHEIRNPLGSIVMASKQLAGGALSPEDKATVVGVLDSESRRLSESLTNFLNYSRPRELKLGIADVNALVDDVVRMIQANAELMGEVKISLSLSDALKPLRVDADQLRQVVWNLALNALQAMGGRGKLGVETATERGWALLRISDSGPGISEAVRGTLFRPFSTTKQKGTGLGLAIADRIVKAHGGRIEVETGSAGTAFTINLPTGGS